MEEEENQPQAEEQPETAEEVTEQPEVAEEAKEQEPEIAEEATEPEAAKEEPKETEPEKPNEEPTPAAGEPEGQPQPEKPSDQSQPPPTNQDALSMEFLYYGAVLKIISPTISNQCDRESVTPWIKKLFRPEYQATPLKDKRNRYLCSLTCNLLNDEVKGVFQQHPPEGALADTEALPIEPSTTAEWETDRMWQETLLALPDDFEMMECSVHGSEDDCKNDHKFDKVLDQEFQFLLYLTRPLAAMLPAEDKTRIAAWLQVLCSIHGVDACSSMKAIRNDYIMALVGYLNDLRIAGPFVDYPPEKLGRLDEAAKEAAKTYPVIDPTGHEANQFLLDQPVPDDGAFCYVALTGDLVASNLR